MKFVADGGAVESQTFDENWNMGATLEIGGDGGLTPISGHIKNFRIWNYALSDAAMQAMAP